MSQDIKLDTKQKYNDDKKKDYTQSMTSSMTSYLAIVENAVKAPWPFPFKRHPDYRGILEHVSAEQGSGYWKQIETTCPSMLYPHVIKRFLTNDQWGNPITHNFSGYEMSPTTLRYMKVTADIEQWIGRGKMMGANVVEIGVGYGGLAHVMNAWNPHLNSIYLVDLPIVTQLAKKYLSYLPNTQKVQTITTDEIGKLQEILKQKKQSEPQVSIVGISNYALTECEPAVRRNYVETILSLCDYGYLTVNMLTPEAAQELRQMLTRSDRIVVRLDEIPLTAPGNHILMWSPKEVDDPVTTTLKHSQSQIGQDRYVTHVFGHTHSSNRYYLEIGAHDACKLNNTFVLETLGWKGLSFDIDPSYKASFESLRCNPLEIADVTVLNWQDMFQKHKFPALIDYLSMDVDEATLATLSRFPFDQYKFRIMTVEHDRYRFGPERAASIRAILEKHGYRIVVKDISLLSNPFEDWWYHPDHLSGYELHQLECLRADNIDFASIFRNVVVTSTDSKDHSSLSSTSNLNATLTASTVPPAAVKTNIVETNSLNTTKRPFWLQTMERLYGIRLQMPAPQCNVLAEAASQWFLQTIAPWVKGTLDVNPSSGTPLLCKPQTPCVVWESNKSMVARWKKEQKHAQVLEIPPTGFTGDELVSKDSPINLARLDVDCLTLTVCARLADLFSKTTETKWEWIQIPLETAEQAKMILTSWHKAGLYPFLFLLQLDFMLPIDEWVGSGIYVLSHKAVHTGLVQAAVSSFASASASSASASAAVSSASASLSVSSSTK